MTGRGAWEHQCIVDSNNDEVVIHRGRNEVGIKATRVAGRVGALVKIDVGLSYRESVSIRVTRS